MPENRFYTDSLFQENHSVNISGEELHHLRVMRKKMGDPLELVNGKNELAKGALQEIGKHSALIHIEKVVRGPKKEKKVVLVQAFTRPSALEYIIEKGTELGVSEFWLFPGARSEKKELGEGQKRRLHLLLIAAMKQCGRLDLPEIHEKTSLAKWNPLTGQKFFGDVREKASPLSLLSQEDVFFFIGPESGFSDEEVQILEQQLQAKGVKLHENILRVDTAALAAMALVYAR